MCFIFKEFLATASISSQGSAVKVAAFPKSSSQNRSCSLFEQYLTGDGRYETLSDDAEYRTGLVQELRREQGAYRANSGGFVLERTGTTTSRSARPRKSAYNKTTSIRSARAPGRLSHRKASGRTTIWTTIEQSSKNTGGGADHDYASESTVTFRREPHSGSATAVACRLMVISHPPS